MEGRRLLIVQIDGLSRALLREALGSGTMPFVNRLLRRQGFRLSEMSVGLPTSTPAFQLAVMYGVKPDIPGFHYYDRQRRDDVYFTRVGDAARVEAMQAIGRPGILSGGSSHGCVFSGGAQRDVFTLAMRWRPTGRGILSVVSSLVVLGWVLVKGVWLSIGEVVRAVLRWCRHPAREGARGWRWLLLRLGCSIWLRQLYTLVVSAELYAGVRAIYVNYVDYDVFAHAFGPRHRHALRALRNVDASIHQLCNVLRRVPEHRYDLYILSDHGQTTTTPYQALHDGTPFEQSLFDDVLDRWAPADRAMRERRSRVSRWARVLSDDHAGVIQRVLYHLGQDFPWKLGELRETAERDGVRVVSAGPNAFVYFVDSPTPLTLEQLDERVPGLVDDLSRHRGIGFVLVRSAAGNVCVHLGKRAVLSEREPGPFKGREDLGAVLMGVRDLMAMPSAGDLVIYGHGSGDGDVSFIAEHGAHAGASPEELHTFIIHPAEVRLPVPLDHPVQLYPHFAGYLKPGPI
jgi:Type I phosphodiesterase / nucleotide pyrophosphatase